MLHDPLADAISVIKNADKVGKKECAVKPVSKIISDVLGIMHDKGYIGEVKTVREAHGGVLSIQLLGAINDLGVIKPRHAVKATLFQKWEKRYLPASGFGTLIVSTPEGVKAHNEVKNKSGGVLLAYIY